MTRLRRTMTIDTHWPDGIGGQMQIACVGRDRGPDGVRDCGVSLRVARDGEILAIAGEQVPAELDRLRGMRLRGGLRGELARIFAGERAAGSLFHALMDDLPGAHLVAGSGQSWWGQGWDLARAGAAAGRSDPKGRFAGICAGFRPGSAAIDGEGRPDLARVRTSPARPLLRPREARGRHALPEQAGIATRRARAIDMEVGDAVNIVADFQDSATTAAGPRIAVHDYRVTASADPGRFALTAVAVAPHALPYGECLGAAPNAELMLGMRLCAFREQVPAVLGGTLGCTHLNDVLRMLADVPALVRRLR